MTPPRMQCNAPCIHHVFCIVSSSKYVSQNGRNINRKPHTQCGVQKVERLYHDDECECVCVQLKCKMIIGHDRRRHHHHHTQHLHFGPIHFCSFINWTMARAISRTVDWFLWFRTYFLSLTLSFGASQMQKKTRITTARERTESEQKKNPSNQFSSLHTLAVQQRMPCHTISACMSTQHREYRVRIIPFSYFSWVFNSLRCIGVKNTVREAIVCHDVSIFFLLFKLVCVCVAYKLFVIE